MSGFASMVGDGPVVVSISGAAGMIGSQLITNIMNGSLLGDHYGRVELRLLEIPQCQKILDGIAMELIDCVARVEIVKVVGTSDPAIAFAGAHLVLLVGSVPRGPGMLRGELLSKNGPIFKGQGRAIAEHACPGALVTVVGNPANSNCLMAFWAAVRSGASKGAAKSQFTALTRLDLNRGRGQLLQLLRSAGHSREVGRELLGKLTIWGNHSPSMVPDASACPELLKALGVEAVSEALKGVPSRGNKVIKTMGRSSALSAASAACDHVREWVCGTPAGQWSTMSVIVEEGDIKGIHIPEGLTLCCSIPVIVRDGLWESALESVPEYIRDRVQASVDELVQEAQVASDL